MTSGNRWFVCVSFENVSSTAFKGVNRNLEAVEVDVEGLGPDLPLMALTIIEISFAV